MSVTPPTVVGEARLRATLAGFAREVADLPAATHTAAAQPVAQLAALRARRRTAQLAASFTAMADAQGTRVGSAVRYAAVQELGWPDHNINPSYALLGALDAATDQVADTYAHAVDTALAKVKGA